MVDVVVVVVVVIVVIVVVVDMGYPAHTLCKVVCMTSSSVEDCHGLGS